LTMLAFGASYFHPAFLIPVATGMVAKKIADPAIRNKASEMINQIGQIPPKQVTPLMYEAGAATSATVSSLSGDQK